jgi:pSer/pThr/pTyr-binding forkhead associated (FHA) protein
MANKNENIYYGILKGNAENVVFMLDKEINIIGRGNSCNVILNNQSISKEHASIEFGNEVILRDLHSANGCYVNDLRVKDGNVVKLTNLDKIRFGKDPNTFTLDINYQMNDQTVKYPSMTMTSMIKDDRISLVNEDIYKKATRNHFEKKFNIDKVKSSTHTIKIQV